VIARASGTFDTPSALWGLVLLAVVGVIVNSLLNVFEAHVLDNGERDLDLLPPAGCVCFELLGKLAELPLRRSTQAAESEFLHPVRDGSHEQLAAEVG